MPATAHAPLLDLQRQVWKARAQAKQKWLEQALAEPPRNPGDAERRKIWVKRALSLVKRAQTEITNEAALMDAYTEHLSVLEMSLIGAAEQMAKSENTPAKRRE